MSDKTKPFNLRDWYDTFVQDTTNEELLKEKFDQIDSESIADDKVYKGARDKENYVKNRYMDVVPYNDTRFCLGRKDPVIRRKGADETVLNTYINSSIITLSTENSNSRSSSRGLYVAAQGPLDPVVEDFWLMVWQNGSNIVVNLANQQENGSCKYDTYHPDRTGVSMTFGIFTVTLEEEISGLHKDIITIRKLSLKNSAIKSKRDIFQVHFTGWPDHGVPSTTDSFLEVIKHVNTLYRNSVYSPQGLGKVTGSSTGGIIVHCSAGLGRTGVFIAAHFLIQLATERFYSYEGCDMDKIDIVDILKQMRICRSGMIQTWSQFSFTCQAVRDALSKLWG